MEIDKKMEEYLAPLFGDMASMTIKMQKDKLSISEQPSREEYLAVVESIHHLCDEMAGKGLANKIRMGLLEILKSEYDQAEV